QIGVIGTVLLKFVEKRFGKETLGIILKKAGLTSIDDIDAPQSYSDEETFAAVGICLEVTGWSLHAFMEALGDYFILWAVDAGYDKMMRAMANNLHEFLNNVNFMHYFVNQCSFRSEMKEPNLKCTQLNDEVLLLNYISRRRGLNALVLGLISICEVTEYDRNDATDIHTLYKIVLDTSSPH
ncbi:hypothetical protein PFISCL1PPCAC_13205, partial [Pristionchus fissidentatus]